MDNHETSSSPPTGKRRRGYRPAIVLFVVLAALVIGFVLKNTREPLTAINVPEPSTTGESSRPAAL
jgi:hypothetical protein